MAYEFFIHMSFVYIQYYIYITYDEIIEKPMDIVYT